MDQYQDYDPDYIPDVKTWLENFGHYAGNFFVNQGIFVHMRSYFNPKYIVIFKRQQPRSVMAY